MSVVRTDEGEHTSLRIDGSLDALSTPELRPLLDALVAQRRSAITIELSGLRLIDSSGVGAIVGLYKRVRAQGGQVTLVGLRGQPLAIFRILRLDRVFGL